tara:strand:+ start:266 stop:412 length:147 start_codon:yes stop_codon:yes gene_type:complete
VEKVLDLQLQDLMVDLAVEELFQEDRVVVELVVKEMQEVLLARLLLTM